MGRLGSSTGGLAVAALIAVACGSHIDSQPEPLSLLDPSQVIGSDPSVTVTASGVNPQTLHVNSPVTVRFTNRDSAAHKIEPAPERRRSRRAWCCAAARRRRRRS